METAVLVTAVLAVGCIFCWYAHYIGKKRVENEEAFKRRLTLFETSFVERNRSICARLDKLEFDSTVHRDALRGIYQPGGPKYGKSPTS